MRRLVALLPLAVAACSLAPRYERPVPAVPPSWPVGSPALAGDEQALPTVRYEDIFRDPALQRIIARALANNQNLKAAAANVQIARGTYRVQRSNIFPDLGLTAGATVRDSGDGSTGGTGAGGAVVSGGSGVRTTYVAQTGISNFEIDLFGRLRSLSAAALDDYFATEAAVRATRLSLVGETASAYLTLAADRSLLAIAEDTVVSADRSLRLTEARLRGGIAPRTELRQAETVLAQAQADRAALIAQIQQDRNALELLVGQSVPDADMPASIEAVDGLVSPLPAGISSQVLLRRPDVVQAEYTLRGANARIGAARAAFFPTISLTSIAGLASTALSELFRAGAFNWTVAGQASQSVFDFGGRRGDLEAARGRFNLALAQYQGTVQTAFREVSDALAVRATIVDRIAAQDRLENAARDTLALQEARSREGIDPYLNTLDAQRTFYSARRASAQLKLVRAVNLVQLYRTLGGDQLTEVRRPSAIAAPRP